MIVVKNCIAFFPPFHKRSGRQLPHISQADNNLIPFCQKMPFTNSQVSERFSSNVCRQVSELKKHETKSNRTAYVIHRKSQKRKPSLLLQNGGSLKSHTPFLCIYFFCNVFRGVKTLVADETNDHSRISIKIVFKCDHITYVNTFREFSDT